MFPRFRDTKNVSDFVQKRFVSATNVSLFAQPKKHHEQQCVPNNVSSFASTFILVNQITVEPRRENHVGNRKRTGYREGAVVERWPFVEFELYSFCLKATYSQCC